MRLMRLRAKSEIRRTADSDEKRIGGQARPERGSIAGKRGRMGWLETERPEARVA